MGVDLTLLPAQYETGSGSTQSFQIIEIDRDYDLFADINSAYRLHGRVVDHNGIRCYVATDKITGEKAFGTLIEDPYGDKIRSLPAAQLCELLKQHQSGGSWRSRAALAYLTQAPENLPVYLFWH